MIENGDVLNDNSEPMEGPENGDSLKSNSNSEESESPCAAPDPKSLETEQPMEQLVRRSQWTRTVPSQYDDFVTFDCELNFAAIDEPSSFQEATASDAWRGAMQREYDVLIKNGTWRLVNPPIGIKPIGCKWVYKNKYKVDGSLDKHKARLVAKGYAQKGGVDYRGNFSSYSKVGYYLNFIFFNSTKRMENTSYGC